MKNYRHLASLGSPYHVTAVRGWSDAESKAVIAKLDAERNRNDERRIDILTEAESWCSLLHQVHAEVLDAVAAIDTGSPGVRSQLERAQRAMAAAQLTHLRYLPHAGSA